MRVVAHNRLSAVVDQEATRVAVYDGAGGLVALAFTYADNHVHVCHFADPEWDDVVRMFGLSDEAPAVRRLDAVRFLEGRR